MKAELLENALQTAEEFEHAGFSFSCGRELKTEFFRKRYSNNNSCDLPDRYFFPNTNLTWPVIVAVLNSSSVVWTEKI